MKWFTKSTKWESSNKCSKAFGDDFGCFRSTSELVGLFRCLPSLHVTDRFNGCLVALLAVFDDPSGHGLADGKEETAQLSQGDGGEAKPQAQLAADITDQVLGLKTREVYHTLKKCFFIFKQTLISSVIESRHILHHHKSRLFSGAFTDIS